MGSFSMYPSVLRERYVNQARSTKVDFYSLFLAYHYIGDDFTN